jgi:hypothetical protein
MWPFHRKAKSVRTGKIYFNDEMVIFISDDRVVSGGAVLGTKAYKIPASSPDPDLFAAFRSSNAISQSLQKIPVNYAARELEVMNEVPYGSILEMESRCKLVTWTELEIGHFEFQAHQALNRRARNQSFEAFGQPIVGKDFGSIIEAMRNAMSLAR